MPGASSPPPARTRVGVFGGTFDPPHLGHAAVAADAMRAARLDLVLWVPAAIPPHKRGRRHAPAPARRRMVLAATRGRPGFRLCDLELERGGVSYTVDTLRRLAADHPGWSLSLMMGADLFAGFPAWREAEAIAALADLLVIPRPGAAGPPRASGAAGFAARAAGPPAAPAPVAGLRVGTVPAAPVDISSSRIRGRVAMGLPVTTMVTPAVLTIIEEEGLYREPDPRRGGGTGPARTARERQ